MDFAAIAQAVTTFLIPALPYLLSLSGKAVEKASESLGSDLWEGAKSLWHKLLPKVEAKPGALDAAKDLADAPEDKDYQTALRVHLKKILEGDEIFAKEIKQILDKAEAAGVNIKQQGDRNVAIGGNVSGSTIITGDNNNK